MTIVFVYPNNNMICNISDESKKLPISILETSMKCKCVHVDKPISEINPDNIPIPDGVWDAEKMCVRHVDDYPTLFNPDASFYEKYRSLDSEQKRLDLIRRYRELLLKDVDFIASNPLRWNDLGSDVRAEIEKYRKDLLDITKQDLSSPQDFRMPDVPLYIKNNVW
jgi:hypothetical protein